ncbi:hypothetical protein CLOP_g6433 [Closterium sp. NIES-67]|nr:hypothetical protein CLOP_g6433 [Closterium sp. NIES-67]
MTRGGVEEEGGGKQRGARAESPSGVRFGGGCVGHAAASVEETERGEGNCGGKGAFDGHDDVEGCCDDVDVFRRYRAEALAASRLHARLAAQAARAYDRGDHAAARKLSCTSREEKERAEKLHTEAAWKILADRNKGRSIWELDLHGLLPGEAVLALEQRLKQLEMAQGAVPTVSESVAGRDTSAGDHMGRDGVDGVVLPAKVLSSARPELMVITGIPTGMPGLV